MTSPFGRLRITQAPSRSRWLCGVLVIAPIARFHRLPSGPAHTAIRTLPHGTCCQCWLSREGRSNENHHMDVLRARFRDRGAVADRWSGYGNGPRAPDRGVVVWRRARAGRGQCLLQLRWQRRECGHRARLVQCCGRVPAAR